MKLAAFDTETYAIQPGLAAPPIVCLAWADDSGCWVRGGTEEGIEAGVEHVRRALQDPEQHLGGCNLAYDLAVLSAHDGSFVPLVFAALDQGRMHSTDLLEALHDNARGLMFLEPTGQVIGAYSQTLLETRYLGFDRTSDKKGPDTWRLRYGELDGVPLEQWPQEAVDYPRADARGALELLRIQLGLTGLERHNLQCEAAEMRAAYALQLLSVWGVRTDPALVATVVERLHTEHEVSRRRFAELGIVRVRTASAKETREGKVDDISAEWLTAEAWRLAALQPREPWMDDRARDVAKALRALGKGKALRFAVDTSRLAALVSAAYVGDPPLTETGKVSTARDTLDESDDELLAAYAEAGPGEKHLSAFADVLLQGTQVPINPSINCIVATQRISMRAPNLMQLPRQGGIRECFVPRRHNAPNKADRWVKCSVDYGGLELATLAQVCYTLFDESAMRDALNLGRDLHLQLAGGMTGITYAEAQALRKAKDKGISNKRQAAKPVNFGLPGKMGAAKLVLTARKQDVRFCELIEGCPRCGANPKVTRYYRRPIPPTCSVCLRLAEALKATWLETWPEMEHYLALTTTLAEACDRGEPLQSFGDGMLRLEPSANAASNHFFQNLAAQGAKRALYRVTREAYTDRSSVLYGACRPGVFVHDEIVSELREEVAHEAAHRVSTIMIDTMRELCPDVAITAPPALARRWFKGMEEARGADERLRPWWPADGSVAADGSKRREGESLESWAVRAWPWPADRDLMLADIGATL